jgi:hypothetical protein
MSEFITSAGEICEPYESMGVIDSNYVSENFFDYGTALTLLREYAQNNGADGVIHIHYNERSAIGEKTVCFSKQNVTVFEVRCWGTMIKLKK